MAHTKIAKTTLALAAALMATALAPALAAAGEGASASSSAHTAPADQGGHARHAAGGGTARAANQGGSAPAGTASLGATAAPPAGEAQPGGRTGGHSHRHHRARAQRYLHRHGHRHHHHHRHRRHRPHLSEISYEGSSLATWFGPGLFGRHTACGQILTKQLAGVANRTLPCGTLVEVTYGGRSVTVPVVDRGPYSSIGASWDLTEKTAELLGMTETAQIETKIVGHAKNSPTLGRLAGSGLPEQSLLEEEEAQQQAGPTGGAVAS